MNQFGRIFSVMLAGESHGPGIIVMIDGCPAGIPLTITDFHEDLARRRPGETGTTPRIETDPIQFISGIFNGTSTGSPITLFCPNGNTRSDDYAHLIEHPRPGHADWVAREKYQNFQDYRGGGHFSGRISLARVLAGCIAKKIIGPVKIEARLISAGGSTDIESEIAQASSKGDSVGGIIECIIPNPPIGLGEPFFDSIESLISHAVFAIPGIKGIEFGSGFNCACMPGSECNDPIINDQGQTATNHAGGINGGISNGNPIVFRIAVKPTASLSREQLSWHMSHHQIESLKIKGRHDICFARRVPVVVEAVTAFVLADLWLIRQTQLTERNEK